MTMICSMLVKIYLLTTLQFISCTDQITQIFDTNCLVNGGSGGSLPGLNLLPNINITIDLGLSGTGCCCGENSMPSMSSPCPGKIADMCADINAFYCPENGYCYTSAYEGTLEEAKQTCESFSSDMLESSISSVCDLVREVDLTCLGYSLPIQEYNDQDFWHSESMETSDGVCTYLYMRSAVDSRFTHIHGAYSKECGYKTEEAYYVCIIKPR